MKLKLILSILISGFVILTLAISEKKSDQKCPKKCWCYLTNVRCMFQGLTKVPKAPANTTVLDLRFNEITELPANIFYGLKFLNTILLNDNKIEHLKANTFNGLDNLTTLYLYKNRIASITPGAFAHLPNLRQLYLHYNNIKEILSGTFNNLPKLERLFLQNNQLQRIPADAFINVGPMTRLRLDSNALVCDCDLLWLVERLIDKPTEMAAVCQYPAEMEGKSLIAMTSQDFHCHTPKIMEGPDDVKVNVGDTAYFICRVSGDPKPQIKWMKNSEQVNIDGKRFIVKDDGTLVIYEITENDIGDYECIAESKMGLTTSRKARAIVTASPLIRFTDIPESQTIQSGEDVVLTCRAEGTNVKLEWWRNGQRIFGDSRIFLEDNSSTLRIISASLADSARYVCQARNYNGFGEVSADLKVIERNSNPPKLIYEPPSSLESEIGVILELPCRARGQPKPVITWKKDGSLLELIDNKYKISRGGSLYIYNVSLADSGRYECTASNNYGRVTAQSLVKVKNIETSDVLVQRAFHDATETIDRAINQTLSSLFSGKNGSRHVDPFRLSRFPNSLARAAARPAEIFERTLINIRRYINNGMILNNNASVPFKYKDILSEDKIRDIEKLSGCTGHRIKKNCNNLCYHKKYRSIDGSCNNLKNPTWGSSYTGFRRLLNPIYENGFSQPIGWNKNKLYYGFTKPPARLVSIKLISTNKITSDSEITHMVMQWGQFLDHDLDHALPAVSSESWDGIDCKKSCENAAPCFPMEVPIGDPRINNRRCIDFIRTSAVCGSGMTSILWSNQVNGINDTDTNINIMPREQMNQLTSYLDASQVYGYNDELANDLRDNQNNRVDRGLLREGAALPGQKAMLPYASGQFVDCRRDLLESSINCFVAGDIRANEQVGLLAMHTIWLREHNRIARYLGDVNPHWTGEKVYQESRKIVGAQMQHITYQHWLPKIFGKHVDELIGSYTGYNDNLDASISNVFATAALRFGHTIIQPFLERLDYNLDSIRQGPLNLRDAFFSPWRLIDEGGVDPLIRGMFATAAKLKRPEENLNVELTEQLFRNAHAVALDLAAMNIQRARDHGIPGYLEWRKLCNMSSVDTFDDLQDVISNKRVRNKLKQLYGHPGNIDVWVGGILEDQLPGSKVGPLFKCILLEQFKRTRDGDRLWYENPSTFKPEQLDQIKKSTLSRVICDNSDNITFIQRDIFVLPEGENQFVSCDDIPSIDLTLWSDCCDSCQEASSSNSNSVHDSVFTSSRFPRETNNVFDNTEQIHEIKTIQDIKDFKRMVYDVEKELDHLNKVINKLSKRAKELKSILKNTHTHLNST